MNPVSRGSAGTATVLMVDDDRDDIFLLQRAFRQTHWDGRFASVGSGRELFAYLDSTRQPYPDVLLLDINLANESGFDVLSAIRREARFRQLPVVVLTTSSNHIDVDRAYSLGANSYLTKPNSSAETVVLARRFTDYWFETSRLPAHSATIGH